MVSVRAAVLWAFACSILTGCAGGGSGGGQGQGPAPRGLPADVLSAPFERKQHIVCNHLEFEISPEFFAELTTPAKNPFHRQDRITGPPVEYRFVNESGGLTYPVSMALKNLKLTVLESAVVRIVEEAPRRLTLTARGAVDLVGEDGQRSYETLTIRDGGVSASPR